ncbi:MAG: acyl-CoA dehydrogenase family protein [Chloroflexi bacterium]|nr:acyl-CoA dehydrogenase family protein [Chloroflexota bacterium]
MVSATVTKDSESEVKGIIAGVQAFVESEVLPLEERFRDTLADERRLFRDDGRLVDEIDEARRMIRRRSAAAGFYAMFAPKEIGGGGLPSTTAVSVLEAVYRRYGPGRLLIGWANGFLASPLIGSFVDGPSHMLLGASEGVRQQVVPSLLAGEKTICFALTEPDAGSDVWGLKCKARRDGDDWLISGTKQWITNAPYADYAAVFAVTDPELLAKRKGGITCFLVDATAPGYAVENVLPVMGHIASDCGTIALEDVRVPNDRILGTVDEGFRVGMLGISEGRLNIAAGCLGMSEWALDRCLEYVKERKTFGAALSEHQMIQVMLADTAIDIYTTKQTVRRTAELLDEAPATGRLPVKEISITKAYAVEAAQRVMDRAIQIHGATGLSSELPFQEGFRIARTLRIPDGTSEIQRRTIARQLLRGDAAF